jgi:hypothetical protein
MAAVPVTDASLYELYAGGMYKSSSIPVAEARAVVGVPHDIEDDGPEGIFATFDCRCVCLLT